MDNNDFININQKGWDELVRNNKPFSNISLPEYGPFLKRTEQDIKLFSNLKGAKVLDMGCSAGASLAYLLEKGADDIWGLDISPNQIKKAQENFPKLADHFIVSPMEKKADIPHDYFDYILSLFSIGYTSDLYKTLENAYNYLAKDGALIISWTHPFYNCLDTKDSFAYLNKSYFDENPQKITKGPDKVPLVQKNLMLSTIINVAHKVGFYLDTILEEETIIKDDVNGYKSTFWTKEKAYNCPSTIIFKFKKLNGDL